MNIEARGVEYKDVATLRELYREESRCQIIFDSACHAGWPILICSWQMDESHATARSGIKSTKTADRTLRDAAFVKDCPAVKRPSPTAMVVVPTTHVTV